MVSFTIYLEVMGRLEAERNGSFRAWYEMPRRDTIPLKTNCSKNSSSFEKVRSHQPAKLSRVLTFSTCSDVAPT